MSAGWAAGGVRAQAMSRRRVGSEGARELVRTGDLDTAVNRLAAGPYGHDVRRGMHLGQAQHAVAATYLWNLRVLAGWLPRPGVEIVRLLAGWAELANLERLLATLPPDAAGQTAGAETAPYDLGALATVWPRVATVPDRAAMRAALATSPWGDPGPGDDRAVVQALRLTWAARVAVGVAVARQWARQAAALLVAHELAVRESTGASQPPAAVRRATARVLGSAAAQAASIEQLRHALDHPTAAALDADDVAGLWRCEVAWWRGVRRDALSLTTASALGPEPVVGQLASLAADAWLTRAALAATARGAPAEVLDELT